MLIDTTKAERLSEILRYVGEELDIPEDVYAAARRRYSMLADWLKADHLERFSSDAGIYHQGSLRLGTAVRPVKTDDEYDVDLVYRRDIKKRSTTQEKLKTKLKEQLRDYLKYLEKQKENIPELVEGRRCWTLDYRGQFHMDILPSIPDDEAAAHNLRNIEDGIRIPDRELHGWQHSNPKGYADWFNEQQKVLLTERREMMAKAAEVDVEQIPEERVGTPLRRVVQILKRHRDIRYQGNAEDKPISIIITTLATDAYNGEASIYAVLTALVPKMRDGIKKVDGEWWVPNPINPMENFANKWKPGEDPQRAQRFFEWLTQVENDIATAGNQTGIHHLVESLSPVLGESLVKRAAERYGKAVDGKHQGGNLKMAAKTGVLGAIGTTVKKNTWYGA